MPIITYDAWMKDTARIGRSRSAEIKAIDAAFLELEKLGTEPSRQKLIKAFEAWKKKEGPGDAWKRSGRNHLRAVDKLAAMLDGKGDDDDAFSSGRVPDFMHEELINARLGVLYLFSRVSVAPGMFKMVLEGGFDIAGQSMDIGGSSDSDKNIVGKVGKGMGPVGWVGNKIEGKLIPQNVPKNVYLPQGAKPSIEAGLTATNVTSEQILRDAERAEALSKRSNLQVVKDKLQQWFDMLVEKVKEIVRQKFGTVEGITGMIKTLVKGIVSVVASKAAPFVGAGMDIARGVGKTIDAAITRFKAWKEGRDVEVGQGHPATIVQSITRAMTLSLFEGLYQTMKGAGALAMDIVGFGAGAIVNLCISATELVVKFIWRLVETVRINSFCTQARGHWENSQSLDAIHRRPFAFSEWYRDYALNIPLISVLTLNTGICGDKMRYLSMFKSGGQISSNDFQNGVRFLDNLKPWGADYIKSAGYSLRSGGDVLVDRLINKLATSHEKEKEAYDYVLDALKS